MEVVNGMPVSPQAQSLDRNTRLLLPECQTVTHSHARMTYANNRRTQNKSAPQLQCYKACRASWPIVKQSRIHMHARHTPTADRFRTNHTSAPVLYSLPPRRGFALGGTASFKMLNRMLDTSALLPRLNWQPARRCASFSISSTLLCKGALQTHR